MARLNVSGEVVTVDVERGVNAGFSGRDQDEVQAHVDELAEDGVEPPERVPTTYEVSPHAFRTDPDEVRVVGEDTSGEVEFGLVVTGREAYVVAASDHTDRELERDSIQKAKQITPNVVSRDAWRLSAVRDHWDDVEMRAWNVFDGERRLYQEATAEALLDPDTILDLVADRYAGPLDGTAVLSGTVATNTDEFRLGSAFEVELADPVRDRTLSVAYDVATI